MRYYVSVDDQVYEIVIDHPDRMLMDGLEFAADMRPVSGGQLYSLLLDNTSYEVVLDPEGEQRNTGAVSARSVYGVMVSGRRYVVRVQDERSRRLALADRSLRAPEGELAVKAPIPGLIVRVVVTSGQSVMEGETVLILEAMKMENELRAPRAGTIHEVRVEPGMQVATGQVLVTIR